MMEKTTRIARKNALDMEQIIHLYIKSMKIGPALNTKRIFKAWDEASGAAQFTVRRFYRDGKLYITLDSSVVRNQLYFQKDMLLEKINNTLTSDILFSKDDEKVSFVKQLILK